LNKINKNINDFSDFSEFNVVFRNKPINSSANYSFSFMGKVKDYNYENYEYYIVNGNPTGFVYSINLLGKAFGKAESVQKAFEKKLTGYSLMKKGYINGNYTSVYKNNKNFVITSSENSNNVVFYIYNTKYEISSYLAKITQNSNDSNYESVEVDTTAIEVPYEEEPNIDIDTTYYGE
jgi:hypothetical protein